ncbi:hypothetical protein R1sor_016761 [Riccia sorocarpa]|uniref:NB-ARC domain-containing protein n=1 Tax=Riccia sorocarpa TaxID=122646 RepID=A0ABD3HG01_9MARC
MESGLRRDFILTHSDHESQVDNSRGGRDEASSSSGHESRLSQENIERISDALYKFYEPTEARRANLDIFFFHALECEGAHVQDAHISSWRSSGKLEEIWPQKWLSHDFPHSRIISISYDCCTQETDEGGTMDLYRITENLLQEIVWARKQQDCDRAMIFVGHGFGGIVMKQLCVYAHNRKEDLVAGRDVSIFLDSIQGLFFYATPHLGVEGLNPPGKKDGPLLRWMYALNGELARLHDAFCKLEQLERYRWIIFAVAGQDSTLGRPGLRLPEGSSRYGDNYITVTSSHFYVCRPPEKTSNEYQHLQTFIQDVLRRVESERKPYLTVPKVIVGFDGLVSEVLEEHFRTHKFVGICGMGGIGKSTLAKLVFNKACVRFEFTCFVEEVKGLRGPKSDIKKKVWEQMRHRAVPVRKADQVYEDVWYQVKGKSLLLIFDDVDNEQQVELLQEIADDNGCIESRFILTSRKSDLLREEDIHIIHPDTLGKQDAEKLLTAYAFSKEQELSESLRKIIQEVIEACEGLPLTLEILGKHLRSRRTELWAEIPIALRRCTKDIANLEHKLWARLRLSYDGLLGNEVQNMFLDMASYFIQGSHSFDADYAVMAWSSIYGCVESRLDTLVDRSLVTVRRYEEYGATHTEFYMHEHLRRMGQRIAREKGRSLDLSRIGWSAESTLGSQELGIFQGSKIELGKIVAHDVRISEKLMEVLGQSCSFCIMYELLPKLAAVQFLDLRVDVMDPCEQCRRRRVLLPSTLVLLGLHGPLCVEAGGNSAGNLIGTLSLSACELEEAVPDVFGHLKNLRNFHLLCRGLENNLVESWGKLSSLEYLRIESKGQTSLLEVTLDLRSDPRRLRINLKGELAPPGIFEPLPAFLTKAETFGLVCEHGSTTAIARNMISLKHLDVTVHGEQPFQDTFRRLRNLRKFEFVCSGVENNLVESLGTMINLEYLTMKIQGQQIVADTFGHLQKLRRFQLVCSGVENSLVESLGNMMNLEYLSIEIRGQQVVQDIFGHLQKLRWFHLVCSGVENSLMGSLGKLSSLEYLRVESKGQTSLLEVTLDLRSGPRRLRINLKGELAPPGIFEPLPAFLTKVETFGLVCEHGSTTAIVRNMISLEHLDVTVHGEQPVQDIFKRLRNLRKFKLVCGSMENNLVESLGNMINLEDLTIEIQGHISCRLFIFYR